MAQIAGPLAAADISAYYISTFNFDHALVSAVGWAPGRTLRPRRVGRVQDVVRSGWEAGVALTPPSAHLPTGA